jgi:hypothetical protein
LIHNNLAGPPSQQQPCCRTHNTLLPHIHIQNAVAYHEYV